MGIQNLSNLSILHKKKYITMKKFLLLPICFFVLIAASAQKLPKAPCTTLVNAVLQSDLQKVDTTGTRGIADNYAMWENGDVIQVKFMPGGSKNIRDRVMQAAREWEQFANIKFKFVPDNATSTNIRIKLGHGLGHNSAVGKECNMRSQSQQTMNFDTVYFADTRYYVGRLKAKGITPPYNWDQIIEEMSKDPYHWDAKELRRVVVHEFGHSLGLLHEQSFPGAIKWKKTDSVYNYYWETQGWDRDRVDFNVFEVADRFYTNGTTYDPKSIMHYSVESWQTEDGYSLDDNYDFSTGDKALVAALYPKNQKVSSKLVPRVDVSGFTKLDVIVKNKKGLAIMPAFDLKTNPLRGDVYFLARLVDEEGYYVKSKNPLYYNWGGAVATYLKMNLLPNSKVSYNKGKTKNLELYLPYTEIPNELIGKKVYVEFSVVLDDVKNNQLDKLMYYNSTNAFTVTK
jgi:hypothetical protein